VALLALRPRGGARLPALGGRGDKVERGQAQPGVRVVLGVRRLHEREEAGLGRRVVALLQVQRACGVKWDWLAARRARARRLRAPRGPARARRCRRRSALGRPCGARPCHFRRRSTQGQHKRHPASMLGGARPGLQGHEEGETRRAVLATGCTRLCRHTAMTGSGRARAGPHRAAPAHRRAPAARPARPARGLLA